MASGIDIYSFFFGFRIFKISKIITLDIPNMRTNVLFPISILMSHIKNKNFEYSEIERLFCISKIGLMFLDRK